MKIRQIVIALTGAAVLIGGCRPSDPRSTDPQMTQTLGEPDPLDVSVATGTEDSGRSEEATVPGTLYTGEVYAIEEALSDGMRSVLEDQFRAALDRENLDWTYRGADQETIDTQWKRRIQDLDLEPATLFTQTVTRRTDLPEPFDYEALTIVYEGALSAEEGYRMLADIPDEQKTKTRSYALSVMEVNLNDFPVLYICLWLSAS